MDIPQGRNPDAVMAALAECSTFDDIRQRGIFFHGTCEAIEGPLRAGDYDNVFWMAETSSVAQSYIPASGVTAWISAPRAYERDDHLRPTRGVSHAMNWALQRSGAKLEDMDVTWDGQRAHSWRIPPGWPTEGDYEDYLISLGYSANDYGIYEVSETFGRNGPEIMPADWKMPGLLIIALAEDIQVETPDWSEGAFSYAPHNRVADFERFAQKGYEAFRMQDALQSKFHGNVGHTAIGILPAGLEKLSWIAIPATRHDSPDARAFQKPETEDFLTFASKSLPEWRRSLSPREWELEIS